MTCIYCNIAVLHFRDIKFLALKYFSRAFQFRMELIVPSCIRAYHVYGEVWTAALGEQLYCEREPGNVVDRYAMAVKKPDSHVIVGHLPQKISRVCSMFTQRGGEITATVTGHHCYSSDLAQGDWKFLVTSHLMVKKKKSSN